MENKKLWYKNHRRRALLDTHIDDWNEVFLQDFHAETYYKLIKEANVDTLMIEVLTHMGLCYWPTKTGKMHRGFRGREDEIRRLFELCRRDGIKTVVYYSLIYNNWAYENYPEWRMVNPHGITSRQMGSRYGLCCPNNDAYREFTKKQIDEVFEYFAPFDGFFFDMTYWPMVCQCESCQKKYQNEMGEKLPNMIDWQDESWLKFQKKREEWLEEYAFFATSLVKEHDSQCSVEHQYGNSFIDFWRRGVTENVAKASDYIGTDLIGGIQMQTFACKAWYSLTENQPFQYMHNIAFGNNWTHLDGREQLLRFAMTVYAHHGALLMIDSLPPEGKINKRIYERMGELYYEIEKYEPYIEKGNLVYDTAVYLNLEGKYNPEQKVKLTDVQANDRYVPHTKAVIDAVNILAQGHVASAVIGKNKLKKLVKGKVLIVPDAPGIEKSQEEEILRYVKDGGRLYMSGNSLPEILQGELGLKIVGIRQEDEAYIVPTVKKEFFGEYDSDHPIYVRKPIPVIEGNVTGEVLAQWSMPYNAYSAFTLGMFGENDGSFCVDFSKEREWRAASIHDNFPAYPDTTPSMVIKKTGKGLIFWSAIPIESSYGETMEQLFLRIINNLIKENERSILVQGPKRVEAVMFHDDQDHKSYVTLINRTEDEECEPVFHITVKLKGRGVPRKVRNLTKECEKDFSWENGWLSFYEEEVKTGIMYEITW